jgi:hypothetical protein
LTLTWAARPAELLCQAAWHTRGGRPMPATQLDGGGGWGGIGGNDGRGGGGEGEMHETAIVSGFLSPLFNTILLSLPYILSG